MPRKKNQSREGKNRPTKKGGAKQPKAEITGKVMMTREGYAFIATEVVNSDIFIPARKLRGALHGDLVRVVYSERKTGGSRREGEVIEIVERSKRPYIGVLQIVGDQAWVITEGKNMPYDIRVEIQESDKVHNGFKVAAMVDDWPRRSDEPIGHLIDVLGMPGDNNTEMHAILTEFGLPYKFDPKVEREAEQIPDEITAQDIKERRDFRGVTTFTIDPTDAKDFDDALSLKELSPGNWEVGVHIADVTHYVRPGTTLDKEALDRGTSVYLVDRTVPMLPEKLSNRLCSLRPREEKLCFSAVFEMDEKSRVHKRWFGRTIIKSDYRFDYEQAQDIIETQKGPLVNEMLKLHQLAKQLREERFRKGAISFERPEMKVEVDKDGKPTNIIQKISKDSNWLIEEFMLLANRAVAKFVFLSQNKDLRKKGSQSVYRIHPKPDPERIQTLATFLKAMGFDLKNKDGVVTSKDLNALLKEAKGTPNEELINTATIRSMAKATYSTKNIGHFSLAFAYYTHFTSPIRRYPDVLVHRFLERELKGGKIEKDEYQKFESICLASSELEKKASDAERASIKYKQVEYMTEHVGEEFNGSITGVTEWGIYIEDKETKCEGMVKLRDLDDDYYVLDEKNYTVKGEKSGRKFTLGDSVRFKVVSADMEKRVLDYKLVS